ncbi:ankyrin [Morchella conica CCBAS932]|uniref:Ankyrin n=1 Tax=Morchella conica CCBAS932 TaxID=1392247 RepID=A0A3N4KKU8_9PEZI|nr:ankyrin [Morchella conica CCBAS932]
MTSCICSEYTPYQRPKRGLIQTSSSSTEYVSSGSTDISSQSITTFRASTSTAQRKSKFLGLIRHIGNAIATLEGASEFSSLPTTVISQVDGETAEFLGRGKTFHVSRLPLPETLELKNSWPKRLVVQPPVGNLLPRTYHANPITCKRPMIEFDSFGNPKEGAVEERLEAVILEVRVLTHPPMYFHKNIVDFLGVSWQCELPEVEPGQTETDLPPPKRVPVILLEYAKHGSLEDFMQTTLYDAMSFDGRVSLCRDIAEGLAVLHKHQVVHGDIKPDNILIFEADEKDTSVSKAFGLRAKLADFGFSVGFSGDNGTEKFSLKGRTWPWNDPEWNKPRTWTQLKKSDVFSYGLLVWTLLSKKDIGALFDLEGKDYDRNNPEIRDEVERLKDWTLSSNASTYFKHSGKVIETLVQCLFRCSLEPDADMRGSMEDILRIWDTWFFGDGPYVPIPPGTTLRPELGLQRIETVSFQRIVGGIRLFPVSIKKEFTEICFDQNLPPDERCQAKVFRAFSLLMGWVAKPDFPEAKRLIDECASTHPPVAIFQPMFFEMSESRSFTSASQGKCTEYEQQAFKSLMTMAHTSNSYEVFQQLMRYFPMPKNASYSRLRSLNYRIHLYGIPELAYSDAFSQETDLDELVAIQMADIERFHRTAKVLALGHSAFHYAVSSGFVEAVDLLLQTEGFRTEFLEFKDALGFTPLLSACRLGNFRIAKLLIGAGSNVTAKTSYGETILHFLCEFEPDEMSEIADVIMALGGSTLVNTVCTERYFPHEFVSAMMYLIGPPLNTAIMRGNIKLIKILLKYGASPVRGRVYGDCPLEIAASAHCADALRIFWNAFPEAQEWRDGRLLRAAIRGFAEFQKQYFHGPLRTKMMQDTIDILIDRLLEAGLTLTIGDIPLIHYATEVGTVQLVEHILIRTDAMDINTYCQEKTPIHVAIERGTNELFHLLIKYGSNLYLKMEGRSCLSRCALGMGSTSEMQEYLLGCGVGREADGSYPDALTDAVGTGKLKDASALLAAGASIDELTTKGGGWTTFGLIVRTCGYNSVAFMTFLFDHQLALGRKPAGFMALPMVGWTVLHVAALIPFTTPFYDRVILSNVLDYLLDKFCSPEHLNAQDMGGYTPLHLAAQNGNPMLIRRLLAFDAIDITIRSHDGKSVYGCALEHESMGVPEIISNMGVRAVKSYTDDMRDTIALLHPLRGY